MMNHSDIMFSVCNFVCNNNRVPKFISFSSNAYDHIRENHIEYMQFSERSLVEKYSGMIIEINYNQKEDFTLR